MIKKKINYVYIGLYPQHWGDKPNTETLFVLETLIINEKIKSLNILSFTDGWCSETVCTWKGLT